MKQRRDFYLVFLALAFCSLIAVQAGAYERRVICGNTISAYTDVLGNTWFADQSYQAGNWGYLGMDHHAFFPNDVIENTIDPWLYKFEQLNQSYRFDVPASGVYYLKLLFAENWWGVPGHDGVGGRVFDVIINGEVRISALDILAECGGRGRRALVKEIKVTVTDSGSYPLAVVIETAAIIDQAKFSAIELSDQPTLTDTQDYFDQASPVGEEAYRVNCGGKKVRIGDQTLWMADEPWAFGLRWGYLSGTPGQVTPPSWSEAEDYLLQTWHTGDEGTAYRIDCPNGTYQVGLIFADFESDAPGKRVFDVLVNGVSAAAALDIFSRAGRGARLEIRQTVTVAEETLAISFANRLAGRPILNALEVKALAVTDEDFIDFVQRRTLRFFTQIVSAGGPLNSLNGLVADRVRNGLPDSPAHASIAAVGFGLAALPAAAARGWLDPSWAETRIRDTLAFFSGAEPYLDDTQGGLTHKNGFYFHFLDLDTGCRAEGTEVSPIDTSLLFAGMITAAGFYPGTDIESEARALAARAQWTWLDDSNPSGFVANHWTPEAGFPPYCWSGYNEDVLLDILGMGSASFPLSTGCWFNMTRHWETIQDTTVMIEMPGSPTGLFTHIYPQCFLDLRDAQDDKNNYFQNTRAMAMADRRYCQARASTHSTYAQDGWGLSAGDSPQQGTTYYAYRTLDREEDGTVNPAIMAAALPFWPEGVMPSLRTLYFQYKQFVWGRFGFASTYNLSAPKTNSLDDSGQGWVSPDVIGIDAGAMFLSLENYRTGNIWSKFMLNPEVQKGLSRVGLGSIVIDNFDNDSSSADQPFGRDGLWGITGETFVLTTQSSAPGNTTNCLCIFYRQTPVPGQDRVELHQLNQAGNMTYFFGHKELSISCRGLVGSLRFRFKDVDGDLSAISDSLTVRSGDAWQTVVWDYSGLSWGKCDPRRIESLIIEPAPLAGSPREFYFDNIVLGDQAGVLAEKFNEKTATLVFPNPASRQVIFRVPSFGETRIVIDVYNLVGERVANIHETKIAALGEYTDTVWDCLSLGKGIYFCRIRVWDSAGNLRVNHKKKIALICP